MFGSFAALRANPRSIEDILASLRGSIEDNHQRSVEALGTRDRVAFPPRPQSSSSLVSSNASSDWQKAMRLGQRELANPGRNGLERARYTYDGVVYLVENGRRLIDSWSKARSERSDSHTVLVVDCSGSMRKDDVPGYDSRTEAVYECLARDFIQPQLAKKHDLSDAWVSLIEMSDSASIVFEREPLTNDLVDILKERGQARACSHGNYLPALDCALQLLRSDAKRGARALLVFLSDGAPSDHNCIECDHGVRVWESEASGRLHTNGKPKLRSCPFGGSDCRRCVQRKVHDDCLARVRTFGDVIGRDKLVVGTVAFGPVQEDFTILAEMAKQVPRGHFQKLGIAASALRTAFTSLTSDFTALRSEALGPLTVRNVEVQEDSGAANSDVSGFRKFLHGVRKFRFDMNAHDLETEAFQHGASGIAYYPSPFASGAERLVYRCTEISSAGQRKGLKLVCKEARHEQMMGLKFHRKCARVQTRAGELADAFNMRHGGPASWNVYFVPCSVYEFSSQDHPGGKAYVLAEAELEGRWRKWNNNAGGVLDLDQAALEAITEEQEDEDSEHEQHDDSNDVKVDEIPQCFSHFSYVHSRKRELVCDLQGVWNNVDGFTFTDPVVHYVSETGQRHHNGATDKGLSGINEFLQTHRCGALCRQLNLHSSVDVPSRDVPECVVCCDQPRQGVFRPCGHNLVCRRCAARIEACPTCRQRGVKFEERNFTGTFMSR